MKQASMKSKEAIIRGGSNGFTLIEILIGMVISLLVLAAVYAAYQQQIRATNTSNAEVEMHQNARAVMHYLLRDLRMAGHDPTGKAEAGFTAADATTVTFTMDVTGGEADGIDNDVDGTVDNGETYNRQITANEQITYAYNAAASQITRNGFLLADNINSFTLTYMDEAGNVLPTPVAALKNIWRVRVVLVTARSTGAFGIEKNDTRTESLTSEVNTRNLGYHKE